MEAAKREKKKECLLYLRICGRVTLFAASALPQRRGLKVSREENGDEEGGKEEKHRENFSYGGNVNDGFPERINNRGRFPSPRLL